MFVRRFTGLGNRLQKSIHLAQAIRSASSNRQNERVPTFSTNDTTNDLSGLRFKTVTINGQEIRTLKLEGSVLSNKEMQEIVLSFDNQSEHIVMLNEEERRNLMKKVSQQIRGISDVCLLIELLIRVPEGTDYDNISATIVKRIQEMVGSMNSSATIDVFNLLVKLRCRNSILSTFLADHLCILQEDLTPVQMFSLVQSLHKLLVYHPHLNKHILNCFVKNQAQFKNLYQVAGIAKYFAEIRTNSPTFWKHIAYWMTLKPRRASFDESRPFAHRLLMACASINVPAHLLKKPIESTIRELTKVPIVCSNARRYVNIAQSLAICQSLSIHDASEILHPRFFNEFMDDYKIEYGDDFESYFMRGAFQILQIAAYCRYELSTIMDLPGNVMNIFNKHIERIPEFKHDKEWETTVTKFLNLLYSIAPLETHASYPELHIQTGTFVDAMLWICPKTYKIMPIYRAELESDFERVALIFASDSLFTNADLSLEADSRYPSTRLLGETKMNLRHLRAAKFKPVLIYPKEFNSLDNDKQKVDYIKERIFAPYDDSIDRDWH